MGPLGTNFIEFLIKIFTFSFKKMHLKILSGKWPPFCPGLNVLYLHNDVLTSTIGVTCIASRNPSIQSLDLCCCTNLDNSVFQSIAFSLRDNLVRKKDEVVWGAWGKWCIAVVYYRNWPRYGLRWSGWYCNPAQHELCRPSRGRASRHNECCAGLQYQPRQRRPYKWSISILPQSQFYKKQGKLAFSTSCTALRPHRRLRNDAWRRDS